MTGRLRAVVPYGREGASSRVRVLDWIDELGLDADVVDYGGLANNRPGTLMKHPLTTLRGEIRVRRGMRSDSRLVLSREASPFSLGGLEASLLKRAAYGVYDFDDALFHDRGVGVRRLFSKARKCEAAVVAADHVIAGNDYLAEWVQKKNCAVTVIPSCVNPAKYAVKSSWAIDGSPRLVWMGSQSTEVFLESISEALLFVHQSRGARLTVVSGSGQRSLGSLDRMVDRVSWTPTTYTTVLASADIGISPLADTPYARGKCAYKLLQYGASGLPVIGSPVGANELALRRLRGLAPKSVDEWADALCELIDATSSAREVRGRAGRSAVAAHYSFEAWAPTWRATVFG